MDAQPEPLEGGRPLAGTTPLAAAEPGAASAPGAAAPLAAAEPGAIAAPGAAVEPVLLLSRERLLAACTEEGWRHRIGPEGELRTTWNLDEFAFYLRGPAQEVLLVRGTWHLGLGLGHLETLRGFIEAQHRLRPWPQAHYELDDDGALRVVTVQALDATVGVTDSQLRQHVLDSVSAAASFFGALATELGVEEEP